MAAPMTISHRARRKLPRLVKFARQWIRVPFRGIQRTRVLFIVGSQRSGTRLPLLLLDRAPEVAIYSEGSSPFFSGVLLQPVETVERLLCRSPFPVVALKPICETHRLGELLDYFPDSKAVWIFRNYRDTVNSASAKWRSGREAVRRLAAGELDRAGWRAGGLTSAKLETVRRLYRDDLSLHAANAIMWYLRNDLYFDLRIDRRPDVLLVRYEDIVANTEPSVKRMFAFVGINVPRAAHTAVHVGTSGSRRPFPSIPAEIESLCETLEQRLLRHYNAARLKEQQPALSPLASVAD